MIDFLTNLLVTGTLYVPLVAAAYISFLKLRMADLSIETTWAVAGICTLQLQQMFGIGVYGSFVLGMVAGVLAALVTSIAFVISGHQKLLSGLIAYFIVMAIGFRLLGGAAMLTVDFEEARFGFAKNQELAAIVLLAIWGLLFLILRFWESIRTGIMVRIIGETNGSSASLFRVKASYYYIIGILLTGVFASFGGAAYSIFYGTATNAAGIGLLIKGLFGALVGERILSFFGYSRPVIWVIPIGSYILALVINLAERGSLYLGGEFSVFLRDTDKTAIIGFFLLLLLLARKRSNSRSSGVIW